MLSICFTAHNEEATVRELMERFHKVLTEDKIDYEFVLLDNASTDKTIKVMMDTLEELKCKYYIRHMEEMLPYHEAYKKVIKDAKGDYVFITDADLQYAPEDIRLLAKFSTPIVTGYKLHREDPLLRKIQSRFFNAVVGLFTGKLWYDGNCGFRVYQRAMLKYVSDVEYLTRSPGTEALLRAQKDGHKITFVPVFHYPRRYGKSSVATVDSLVKVFKEQMEGIVRLCIQLRT